MAVPHDFAGRATSTEKHSSPAPEPGGPTGKNKLRNHAVVYSIVRLRG